MKFFFGRPDNIAVLAELYEGRGGEGTPRPNDETFHRQVGMTLGYPVAAIDDFIGRLPK